MKLGVVGFVIGTALVLNAPQIRAEDVLHETRVGWLSFCPSDPKPAPDKDGNRSFVPTTIVTAIGGKLIEGAVDSAANALKAAGESKTVATTAKSGGNFYKVTPSADLSIKGTCLVVVRGLFDATKPSSEQWAQNSDDFKGLQSSSFRLEAKLNSLRGLKYFQLVPQYLKVEEFQESGFFTPSNRDYVLAVSLTVLGGAQPFGSTEMRFKDVVRNTKWENDAWPLRTAVSLPIPYPSESADATKAKTKREAELAPYLLAQDILDTPPVEFLDPAPDVYNDSSVQKKIKLLCDSIDTENRRLYDGHQLIDGRCPYRVTQAQAALDSSLESAHRNAEGVRWATAVCKLEPSQAHPKLSTTKCSNEPPPAKEILDKSFTYFTTQVTLSETRDGSNFC